MYVGELDLGVTKQALVEHFKKKFDSIVDAKIITDPNTRISKGFGFVIFSSYDESQRAIAEMQGSLIKGKPIKVSNGFSRNGGGHAPNHQRGAQHGSANGGLLGAVYGAQPYGPGAAQPRAGSILGGLGAQFKQPEPLPQQFLLPAQQFAYLGAQAQQLPAQLAHGAYALAGSNAALYQHQLASQQQQLLFNYQAALKAGLAPAELQGAFLQVDHGLQALGLAGSQGLAGLYPTAGQLGGLNPQLAAGQFGYQLYFPAPGGMAGPGQAGGMGWGPVGAKEEAGQVGLSEQAKAQKAPQQQAEEVPLEIQSNNKLAILNFMQNYDPKTN